MEQFDANKVEIMASTKIKINKVAFFSIKRWIKNSKRKKKKLVNTKKEKRNVNQ